MVGLICCDHMVHKYFNGVTVKPYYIICNENNICLNIDEQHVNVTKYVFFILSGIACAKISSHLHDIVLKTRDLFDDEYAFLLYSANTFIVCNSPLT
jgi:hypothetical protein